MTRPATPAARRSPSLLVLGGSGLLGTEVVDAARGRGWTVHAPPHAEVDVTDPAALAAALDRLRPEVVVGAAAWTDVDGCEDDPERAHRLNAVAPGALAGACSDRGVRLVHLSTDYVFGGGEPPRDADGTPRGWREDDPPAPVNVYGHSKRSGEVLVHRADPDHLVVRTAWLSGVTGGFVPTILRAAQDRVARAASQAGPRAASQAGPRAASQAGPGPEPLRGVADRTGSPTVAHHLAVGLLDAIGLGATGTLHLAGGGAATWFEVARWVVEVAGLELAVEPCQASAFPQRAARPAWSVLDLTRAAEVGLACPGWREQVADLVRRLPSAAEPPAG